MLIKSFAIFFSPLKEKFGIPRQANLAPDLEGRIVFSPEYRNPDALKGLEDFDYLWLIWGFSEAAKAEEGKAWSPTVRPPRLGGNERMGVFATRSPFRPNHLGLSSVKIKEIIKDSPEGPVIIVSGADLMDGTPIYDIKPYVEYADSHPGIRSGFVDNTGWKKLNVTFDGSINNISEKDRSAIEQLIALDPRPKYQNDPERIYGMAYKDMNVKFTVSEDGT
ncbi:MAG: tRNA (N6-threonylcarbamoyladenosine(37)-N6)-methyltransferase TrmO, partial [Bacteroidales bacterium]|nr:tRNA (N6-threonylcarbamoyladenosine(37)-N6)-methyltransferase TrmO [Bacteroidales bacterium]